ncbi:hypothetical protein EV368DRAFT_49581 [Lentinula lateritia]|nr:hypothetical protein EV368DRAFT_49581 [Lentinula lateritia]
MLDLPFDLIHPIIEYLTDRTDWNSCCLVSKSFNKVATPLLYQTLDSRIIQSKNHHNSNSNTNDLNTILYHPATTLLSKPSLALHVRHLTETGAVHRARLPRYATITDDALKALALCTNLHSFTWMDDTMYGPAMDALGSNSNGLPLRSLTIRTHSDLGTSVWDSLNTLSGLTRVSVWSMEGPPRVLQGGWSIVLGPTLEELELGRCAGVPPTILITVISQLPLLRSLRLKGVASNAILNLLTYLPILDNLDVEYLPSQTRLSARDQARLIMLPSLKTLTVRSNSRIDAFDPLKMYDWVRLLASKEDASSYNTFSFRDLGQTLIPRGFILDLARSHSASLRRWETAEAGVMMMGDVECLCVSFPRLEVLDCAVGLEDVNSIYYAIRSAHNLTTLKLHIQCDKFTAADARSLMLRTEDSILRTIAVGGVLYRVSAVKSFVSHFVLFSSVLYKPGYPLAFAPFFSLHAQLNSSAGKLVNVVVKSGGS